jgi:hypothetical protein
MSKPMIRIHNVETDEIIDREMNSAEYEEYIAEQQRFAAEVAKEEQEKTAAEARKNEVLNKLGLTAEEASALLF